MQDRNENSGSPIAIISFLAGTVVGAGIALLLAPRSGSETREKISARAHAMRDKVNLGSRSAQLVERGKEAVEYGRGIFQQGTEKVQQGKEYLEEKKKVLASAIEAGKEAMEKEKEALAASFRSGDES